MEDNMPIVVEDEGVAINPELKGVRESFQLFQWNVSPNNAQEIGDSFLL
jgi:hypothetical protein